MNSISLWETEATWHCGTSSVPTDTPWGDGARLSASAAPMGRSPPLQPPNLSRGPSPKIEVPPGAVCRVRLPTPASHRHRYSGGAVVLGILVWNPNSPQLPPPPFKSTNPNPSSPVNINPASPPQNDKTKTGQTRKPRPKGDTPACCASTLHMVTTMEPHRPPFLFLVTAAPCPRSGVRVRPGSGVRASQPGRGGIDRNPRFCKARGGGCGGQGSDVGRPGRVTCSVCFFLPCKICLLWIDGCGGYWTVGWRSVFLVT